MGIKIYRSVIKLSFAMYYFVWWHCKKNGKTGEKCADDVLNLWRRSAVIIIGLCCDQLQQIARTKSTFSRVRMRSCHVCLNGQFGPLSCRLRQPVNIFVFAGSSMWRSSPSCWWSVIAFISAPSNQNPELLPIGVTKSNLIQFYKTLWGYWPMDWTRELVRPMSASQSKLPICQSK